MDLEGYCRRELKKGNSDEKILSEISDLVLRIKFKEDKSKCNKARSLVEAVLEEVKKTNKKIDNKFINYLLNFPKANVSMGEIGVGSRGKGDFFVHEKICNIASHKSNGKFDNVVVGAREHDDAGIVNFEYPDENERGERNEENRKNKNFVVVSVDGTHSRLSDYPFIAGFHVARAALRDIYVKGAKPIAFFDDLHLADDGDVGRLFDFIAGISVVAELADVPLVAGSTLRIGGDMVIGERMVSCVGAIGIIHYANFIKARKNIKIGDKILMTKGAGGGTIATTAIYSGNFDVVPETLNVNFIKACKILAEKNLLQKIDGMLDVTNGGIRGDAYEVLHLLNEKNDVGIEQKIDKIIEILRNEYKEFFYSNNDPFYVLISTILSQRTKDEKTKHAVQNLFKFISTPQDVLKKDITEIENAIKAVNFYKTKAKRIVEISKTLIEKYNGNVPNNEGELLKLSGVGRKTANCVLAFAFNKHVIPVDTHVHRISNRVGLISTKTPEESERELTKILPKQYWKKINYIFVQHGQNICLPRNPKCNICKIKEYCEHYKYDLENDEEIQELLKKHGLNQKNNAWKKVAQQLEKEYITQDLNKVRKILKDIISDRFSSVKEGELNEHVERAVKYYSGEIKEKFGNYDLYLWEYFENCVRCTEYIDKIFWSGENEGIKEYILKKAEGYYDEGAYDEAIEWCKNLVALDPWNEDAFCLLGNTYYKLEDYKKAEKYYEKYLSRKENLDAGLNYVEGIELLEKIFKIYALKGNHLFSLNKNYKDLLKEGNELDPRIRQAFQNNKIVLPEKQGCIGIFKIKQNLWCIDDYKNHTEYIIEDTSEQLDVYKLDDKAKEKAVSLLRKCTSAYCEDLGFSLENVNKDYKKAKDLYECAIKNDPTNGIYWNRMATLSADVNEHKKALECYKEHLKLSDADVDSDSRDLEELGLFYSEAGEYEKAIKCFKKLADERTEKDEDDPNEEHIKKGLYCTCPGCTSYTLWHHMGNVYYAIKDYKNALKCYEKALVVFPEVKEKIEKIEKIIGSKACLKFYEPKIKNLINEKVFNMLKNLNIDHLGVSIDALMLFVPPENCDKIIEILRNGGIEIDEIGEVVESESGEGKILLIDENNAGRTIEPLFRESAYTKIKKVIGEQTPEKFEKMKKNVNKAYESALKKKEKILKFIAPAGI